MLKMFWNDFEPSRESFTTEYVSLSICLQMVNEEELKVIDKLIDFGSQTAGDLNYHVVLSLYK